MARWLFIWLLALPVWAAPYQSAGTRKMAQRLEEITRGLDPMQNPFLNAARVEKMEAQLKPLLAVQPTKENFTQRYRTQVEYATELMNAGKAEEAFRNFKDVEAFLKKYATFQGKEADRILLLTAMASLRLGEQENCLSHHNADSCLMPIRDQGVHTEQRGSRGAKQILLEILAKSPKDLRARWLLNLACMTLGEYPDKVPPEWLIPAAVFKSEYDIKKFPNVALDLGLDVDGRAGGVVMDDFDNDGDLDLIISSMSVRDQVRFFRNNGDGTFTEHTQESGLVGELGGLNLLSADYNNDGHLDLLILRGGWMGKGGHYPNSLMRNNGNGTFDDVTDEAGLLSFHPTQTATWLDYNNDGWLDLFIANETVQGDAPQPCELYRSNGNGTFTEVAVQCGVAFVGMFKAVVSGDFNNDGRPDLYLSWRGHDNLLLRNEGPAQNGAWKFMDVAKEAGVTQPFYSFPTWFFDYDNDGWLDLFVSGYGINNVGDIAADYMGLQTPAERVRLYHNNRDGTFKDLTRETKLFKVLHSMGSNFGDLDNDGFLDFYVGTGDPELATVIPNRMFRNAEGKFFQDVTTSGGFGHVQKGHGIAFGDIDNDGDQDIYEVMGGAYEGDNARSVLYENPGHGNNWITLKLEGVKSNRSAIGARIKVTTPDRTIYKTVVTGGSFGCSPLRQEIGLGSAKEIKQAEITWPSGLVQTLKDLNTNRYYKVREGNEAQPWTVKSFTLAKSASDHRH
ncbi:MAG TPA: CRTAC1 family protein [Verrucomicrobiae bacterium]|nr:CRTAC1 family protein [Verrucomicrobiae bacterium]